jgi:hypothetical protein
MANFETVEVEISAIPASSRRLRTRGAARSRGRTAARPQPAPEVVGFHVLWFNEGECPIPLHELQYELQPADGDLDVCILFPEGHVPPPPTLAFLVPRNAARISLALERRTERYALRREGIPREKFYDLVLI